MVGVTTSRRRTRRRWGWVLVALAVVGAGAVWWTRRGGPPPQRVFLEKLEQGVFVREVSGTGTVEPNRRRVLTFPAAGTVAAVGVQEGERIEAGAEIARLDTRAAERDLASNRAALASARADLERITAQQAVDRLDGEAAVTAAENALASASQALSDARDQLAAAERLYAAGGVSENERDAAVSAVDEADRQRTQAAQALDAARSRLAGLESLAQAQARSAEASISRLATTLANLEQQIAEASLTAPFAGVVATVPFAVGERVSPSQAVELVDDSSVHVVADFDENRSVDLAVGQDAVVTPDAAPDLNIPATVTRVDPVASRAGGLARLRAELAFAPEPPSELPRTAVRPGYTVTARVVVHRIPGALLVPLEAIQTGDDGSHVFRVVAGEAGRGTVERVAVRVLDRNATLAAVAPEGGASGSGLASGDAIAVTNVDVLEDGAAVSFEPAEGSG